MAEFSFKQTELAGAVLISPFFAGDQRGGFTKIFEKDIYRKGGIDFSLSETFISVSSKNVIRGLHFQLAGPQAKIVTITKGAVYDVIVDLRPDSDTYKKWQGFTLSQENHLALYIPKGFAHGFLALEDETHMLYQCDGAYDKETDTGIRFDDPDIAVRWPVEDLGKCIHSARDLKLMSFKEYERNPMRL